MEGLVPGRIVYYVFGEQQAAEVNRRRTTGKSIADRMKILVHTTGDEKLVGWPVGAQAHIGNEIKAGDIYPAMVIRVWGSGGCSNLKVFLDGSDDFWATSINYHEAPVPENDTEPVFPHTWHWMFSGQNTRYVPTPPPTV